MFANEREKEKKWSYEDLGFVGEESTVIRIYHRKNLSLINIEIIFKVQLAFWKQIEQKSNASPITTSLTGSLGWRQNTDLLMRQ